MADILEIDDYDLKDAVEVVAQFGKDRYGFIVTPNVDHVIRHYFDPGFRRLYAEAAYILLDSRFLAHTIGLLKRQIFRTCTGSDLTAAVFTSVLKPDDAAVLVGGSVEQAQQLRARFGLTALRHVEPPMNFIADAAAVEACLRGIEAAAPFRFCFLAVGSPQQEMIAQKLKDRGKARGLAMCIGGSINFLTGIEKRAPEWLQRAGFEWFYRLLQNPRRMARRFLVRDPLIFLLLWRIEFRLRRPVPGVAGVKELTAAPEPLNPAGTAIAGSPGQSLQPPGGP